MSFCVYILHSASLDKFYVGYTAQLEERFLRHNQKSKGFTGKAKDWLLGLSRRIFKSKRGFSKRETN
jgi:putative endonuclease